MKTKVIFCPYGHVSDKVYKTIISKGLDVHTEYNYLGILWFKNNELNVFVVLGGGGYLRLGYISEFHICNFKMENDTYIIYDYKNITYNSNIERLAKKYNIDIYKNGFDVGKEYNSKFDTIDEIINCILTSNSKMVKL